MSVIGSCCRIILLLKIFKTSLFAFLYLWMFSGPEVTYRQVTAVCGTAKFWTLKYNLN